MKKKLLVLLDRIYYGYIEDAIPNTIAIIVGGIILLFITRYL